MTIERHIVEDGQLHPLREGDITASAVSALYGVNPWKTIAELHAEKMGIKFPGPDPESAVIRRGHALEGVTAKETALLRREWNIVKANEYLRDPTLRLGATPDFFIHGDPRGLGVLQTKTVGSYKFKREWQDGNGEEPTPPIHVILQNATEVMLSDAAFGAIGVLVVGDYAFDCYVIEIPRNKSAEHKIRVAVHSFWQALEAGEVPTVDYNRDGELVRLMYPAEVAGKVIDLRTDNRIVELCEIRECNAAIMKTAERAKAAAEVELREKLGDAEIAMVQGWRVSLKTTHRPEVLQKAVDYRVLRTSRLKEDA
jgi:predicted phage-related endonuclease